MYNSSKIALFQVLSGHYTDVMFRQLHRLIFFYKIMI